MTDWWQMALVLALAVNPAAAAAGMLDYSGRKPAPIAVAVGIAIAVALAAVAAWLGEPLSSWLDVEPSTLRIGAGVVLVLAGGQAVWRGYPVLHGKPEADWRDGIFPLAIPLLATPALLAALLNYGADTDAGAAKAFSASLAGLAIGAAAVFAASPGALGPLAALARVSGAALVVVAAALIVDGVQSV